MVEVHMRDDQPIDRCGCQSDAVERGQQAWHAVVRAGVDECGVMALDDEVARIEALAMKAGVDDVNAEGQGVYRRAVR